MYGRDKLISLMASPLVAARLHYRDLITVSGLGLAGHRRWRGCRGGADANRSRLFKCWPQFGLANARSVVNKCAMVHDLIVSSQLDLLAITETWLSSLNGVTCLEACSPEGYFSTHVPRMGRRGLQGHHTDSPASGWFFLYIRTTGHHRHGKIGCHPPCDHLQASGSE